MRFIAAAFAVLLAGTSPASFQVRRIPDLAYESGGLDKHRLDLYLPVTASAAPLVLFVHGGAFLQGDRRDVQIVGEALASQGLAVAIPSYRLFPDTNAQGSTQDVADSAAWLSRHAAEYHYDARKIFLVGHSAGAQIVALLGTNPAYFERAGASFANIGGVLAVAGAYDLRDLSGEPDSWQRVDGHIYGARRHRVSRYPRGGSGSHRHAPRAARSSRSFESGTARVYNPQQRRRCERMTA